MLETAHQVGRISVTAPDVSYLEMAQHCEMLLMGKQKKMSHVMGVQMKQENAINSTQQNQIDESKKVISGFTAVMGSL